jgi:hypothetical protein
MDNFNDLDVTKIKKRDLMAIRKGIDKGKDIIYIEVGDHKPKYIEFNME